MTSLTQAERRAKEMKNYGDGCTLEPLDSDRFPWLFWGDKKVARNEQLLRRRKIVYIINCTPPCGEGGVPNFHERLWQGSRSLFKYLRIPVYDVQAETLQPHFEEVWEFMETCRTREDGNMLIHCNHGVSRSAAFVCSYLIRFEGMSADEALAFLRRRNPLAKPNEAFRDQLKQLYERVSKESRFGGSQPHKPLKGGWLPPYSSRKRVAACSLPNPRLVLKATRQMGPMRPPELETSASSNDETKAPQERRPQTTVTPPSSPPEVASCSFVGKAAEVSDNTVEILDGLSSLRASEALCPQSSSEVKGFKCMTASDANDESSGCKDTQRRVRPATTPSEESHHCANGSELLRTTGSQGGDGGCGVLSNLADREDSRPCHSGALLTCPVAKGAGGKEVSLAADADCIRGFGRDRDASTCNSHRLVHPSDGRNALQAAALRVP